MALSKVTGVPHWTCGMRHYTLGGRYSAISMENLDDSNEEYGKFFNADFWVEVLETSDMNDDDETLFSFLTNLSSERSATKVLSEIDNGLSHNDFQFSGFSFQAKLST